MGKIIVICQQFGMAAPYDPPDVNHPWGVWHWHQPCPRCGAEKWVAHDLDYDRRTGQKLQVSR